MNKYELDLPRRVSLFALLLTGVLSLEACQLSGGARPESATNTVITPVAGGTATAPTSVQSRVEDAPVLSLRQVSPQASHSHSPLVYPLASVSERRFIIPVARSGDFAPDQLDDYVLRIIDQSRQWDYVAELQIHGHTDSEGSELSNMLLSIRRANRVAERFEELGVEVGLLVIEAHGETQAIADNSTLDGRIANRRIEVVLIGNGEKTTDAGVTTDDANQYETVVAELHARGDKQ
ncbi:MAG: OmpA family protein [Gammaproteobacteria bacterium]|nr:OmpA family protein [Gammaproteobacteria bacterium]MBQ0839839.1 OmpA family protein [Gammaproteobacteria bacterium]